MMSEPTVPLPAKTCAAPFIALGAIALAACARTAPNPHAVAFRPADGSECPTLRPTSQTRLMGWDAPSRQRLAELQAGGGIVAVRYEVQRCAVELELLPQCTGSGHYTYRPQPRRASILAHDRRELFVQLPIGATRLSSKLVGKQTIRTDYAFVGTRSLRAATIHARDDLVGSDCARATHVVDRIDVGGFEMVVGEDVESATNVFFGLRRGAELIDRGGSPDACDKALADGKESAECAVPLGVGLVPIVDLPKCDAREPDPNAMPASPAPDAFTRIDADIRRAQAAPSKYVYSGSIADVLGDGKGKPAAFPLDAAEVMVFEGRLDQEVIAKNESPEWTVVALTREAEMFERLREAITRVELHHGPPLAPPGKVSLLTPQQWTLLTRLQGTGAPGAAQAADLTDAALQFWNAKTRQELDVIEARIVTRYARAALSARTKNPAALRAVRRLARYTRELGNERMAKLLDGSYRPDMYLKACADLPRGE